MQNRERVKALRDSAPLRSRFVVAVEHAAAQILVEDEKGVDYETRFAWARRCMFEADRSQYYADRIQRLVLHLEAKLPLDGEDIVDEELQGIVDKYVGILAAKGL